MELLRIGSRLLAGSAVEAGAPLLDTRLRAGLLRRAAEAFGARWRGPLAEEEGGCRRAASGPDFYDALLGGPGRVVLLAATPGAGASQALRAACHRSADPGAGFPPVLVSPDSEAVDSGALPATLQQLAQRPVPVYAVDLLGVGGSAMPEALRVVTGAIARDGRSATPARWVLVFDPLYERRLGRWRAPDFFGEVRLEHPAGVDGVSLAIELDAAAQHLELVLSGELASLHLGIVGGPARVPDGDRVARDVARLQRVLDETLADLEVLESGRRVAMPSPIERLTGLAADHVAGGLRKQAFVDDSLEVLLALRERMPEQAVPAAEFVAAYADSHPIEPVPVPEGAGFVETIGRAPAVQPA